MSNTKKPLVLGEDLPADELAKLIKKQLERREQVKKERITYPDPEELGPEDFEPAPDEDAPEVQPKILYAHGHRRRHGAGGHRGGNKGNNKGGGKGKGGPKKGPQWPNPAVVHAEVAKTLSGLPNAGNTGDIVVGEFNALFLDASKARFFQDAYVEMFPKSHIVLLSEVDPSGVQHVAKLIGYTGISGTPNTRAQAVAVLVHPRLTVLGWQEYHQIANVQGIPDLRPALRVDVEDTVTGEKFSVVALHLKSMRGGPKVTSVVRHKQLTLLAQLLGPNFVGIVGGDVNFPVTDPTFQEGDPLYNAGFTLVDATNAHATHAMGSRIDALFIKGMADIVNYQVFQFFANPRITRQFSDHAYCVGEPVTTNTGHVSSKTSGAKSGKKDDRIGGAMLPTIRITHIAVRSAGSGRNSRTKSRK